METKIKNIMNKIIENIEPLMFNSIAHRKGDEALLDEFTILSSNPNIETLAEHSKRTLEVFFFLMKMDNFEILNKCLEQFREKKESALFFLCFSIYVHDFGKNNPNFQKKIRKTDTPPKTIFEEIRFEEIRNDIKEQGETSNHSEYNTIIELNQEYFNEDKDLILFFKDLISSHHSKLLLSKRRLKFEINDFVFISELFFNFIIKSDILATKYFYIENNLSLEEFVKSEFEYINKNEYKLENGLKYNKEIYKDNYSELKENDTLNEVKLKLGREVIKKIRLSNKNIHILKAPTGAGKTNLSFIYINEILKKKNIEKILFINPLNTLNEQVKTCAEEAFSIDNIQILNSLTRYEHKYNEEKNLNIEKFENFSYPFIVTSHVNFFNKLYHKDKKSILSLYNLKNSIIVIDEIQLYEDKLGLINYEYLSLLEKYLNCSILIISATIPPFNENFDIDFLLNEKYEEKLFEHNVFKRVKFSLDYFENGTITDILEKEKNKNSFLITCNTLKECDELYNLNKEYFEKNNYKVYFFNSRIIPSIQETILNRIKDSLNKKEKTVCISTTKIETGVDISFNIGIRFSTSVDNIIQNGGRINRYGENNDSKLYILKSKQPKKSDMFDKYYSEDIKFYKKFIKNDYLLDVLKYYKTKLNFSKRKREEMEELLELLINNTDKEHFERLHRLSVIEADKKFNCYVKDYITNIPLDLEDKNILESFGINSSEEIIDRLNIVKTKKEYELLMNILKKISFSSWNKKGNEKIIRNKYEDIIFYGIENYNYELGREMDGINFL